MILLWPFVEFVLGWIVREVIVKFAVLVALMAVINLLLPLIWSWIAPFTGLDLGGYLSQLSPGVWFWADFLQFSFGFPLLLSAFVTRFTIRRLPFVG